MSLDDVRRYLIAYDVSDDVRRTKVAKKLESYGDRVQYSVFIVDARPAKLLRLRTQLIDMIDEGTDSVLFCNLGTLRDNQRRPLDVIGRGDYRRVARLISELEGFRSGKTQVPLAAVQDVNLEVHDREFVVEAVLRGQEIGTGSGASKRAGSRLKASRPGSAFPSPG